ncbi:MAG: hypothetical protein M3R30_04570 [Candidatus Eremiobacteraeota bacterium]|nr:hypothetical protein [Candidatus Eremiobacteraeota bacterium]
MNFESLDRYLLTGSPVKAEIVTSLLAMQDPPDQARPFLEGLRVLGSRTPDLALIALRLALAGKPHGDGQVTHLRSLVERARGGDATAKEAYAAELA